MARNYFQVTVEGHIGPEQVDNVFYFTSLDGDNLEPDGPDLLVVASAVKAAYRTTYLAAMVSAYFCDGWRVKGYDSAGHPATTIPAFLADGGVGGADDTRDGNVHAINARCALGALTGIVEGCSLLKRAYYAFGPLGSGLIANDGSLVSGGGSPWIAFRAVLDDALDAFATDDLLPIKVSHTANKTLTKNVTSWRPVTAVTFQSQGIIRKSRNNGR